VSLLLGPFVYIDRTTDYHRHEGFWSLVGTDAAKSLHMEDLEGTSSVPDRSMLICGVRVDSLLSITAQQWMTMNGK
jgi:hypothetical protein